MLRMRGVPLPLKAINEANAEMERVVNVSYPTTVDGWRRRDDKREVGRDWHYFPIPAEEWTSYIEPFAKRWERYVRPYRWDKHVRPYQPKEENEKEEDKEDEKEEVELSPELEELKRRLEKLKEELSEDQQE